MSNLREKKENSDCKWMYICERQTDREADRETEKHFMAKALTEV